MMKRPTKIYKTYDIVVVPFPFTDRANSKNRPALILSSELFNAQNGKSIMAMITSNTGKELWPNDIEINELKPTGLTTASVIRFKIFTIDHVLVKARIGFLHKEDVNLVQSRITEIFVI